MPAKVFVGGAVVTALDGGITSGASSCDILDSSGWPSVGPWTITIDEGLSNEETILVDSRTANTLTFNSAGRGYDDTAAASHGSGSEVKITPTAEDFQEFNDHIYNTGLDDHTQYMHEDGTRHDLPVRHEVGTTLTSGTPTSLTPDDAAAEGTSVNVARQDHVHGNTTDVAVSVGLTPAEGTSSSYSRADHVHDIGTQAIDSADMFAVVVHPAVTQSVTPSSPHTGMRWLDLNSLRLKLYDGAAFVPIGGFVPSACIAGTTTTSIPSSTITLMEFVSGDEQWDVDGDMVDAANNRINFSVEGRYTVKAWVDRDAAANNPQWTAILRKNGTTRLATSGYIQDTGLGSSTVLIAEEEFAAADYVEVLLFQTDSGGRSFRLRRLSASYLAPLA